MPRSFHSFYAKTAIEAGKHVFIEKPHAIDPIGIKRLQAAIELAKQKGLCLVSGLQSRYHPVTARRCSAFTMARSEILSLSRRRGCARRT